MGAVAKKWTKPDYRKRVEEMLRLYPLYKKSLEKEMFPSCVSSVGEIRVIGGKKEFNSTTEKYALKRAERRELVEQVEYALMFLGEEEREVIEATYFRLNPPKVYIIHNELNMSYCSYHRVKTRAIKKIAFALGLI